MDNLDNFSEDKISEPLSVSCTNTTGIYYIDDEDQQTYEIIDTYELGDEDRDNVADHHISSSDDEEYKDDIKSKSSEIQNMDIINEKPALSDYIAVFNNHASSIFSSKISPSGLLVASGGEDDRTFLWRCDTGEVIYKMDKHTDSVISCAFSYDELFLSSVDMSGGAYVFNIKTNQIVWNFEVGDVEWQKWHHAAHVLFIGCADGSSWMFKIPSGLYKTFPGQGVKNSACVLLPNGKQMCNGYGDGTLKLWDLKETNLLTYIKKESGCHLSSVTCLAVNNKEPLLVASGSEDGTCKLLNCVTGKILTTLSMNVDSHPDSIECIVFTPSQQLLICGTLSGAIGIWDMPTQKLRHLAHDGSGIVDIICYPPIEYCILTCNLQGCVHLWDTRSAEMIREWVAHQDQILSFDVCEEREYFVTGSADGTVKIFSLELNQFVN